MECLSLKVGTVRVTKHLKKTGSLCCINNYDFAPLLKSFIANELKCKAYLKTKYKCVHVTTFSLVISLVLCE